MSKTTLDHLLYCLGEECGEVQQVAGKAGRFGINDINPHTKEHNIDMLEKEIHDILAVWVMICEEQGRDSFIDEKVISAKKSRVKHYMKYAAEQGELVSA